MKELFNFHKMSKAIVSANIESGKIAAVLFKDFTFEDAAELALDAVKRVGAEAVSKYINCTEIAVYDGVIIKDSENYCDKTAAFIRVNRDEERRRFLILGLPASCKDWFESMEKFDEWLERCPFDVKVIELK